MTDEKTTTTETDKTTTVEPAPPPDTTNVTIGVQGPLVEPSVTNVTKTTTTTEEKS